MTKLHEILAAEKTVNASWMKLIEDTTAKFKKPHMFEGSIKTLKMLEESPANKSLEAAAREEKAMQTTVCDTLEYAFGLFAKAEDLQARKNATNAIATATVLWKGAVLFEGLPIDELLGLESRLIKIRQLIIDVPTLDASKTWIRDPNDPKHVFRMEHKEITTKTENKMVPVVLSAATDKHPAQVKESTQVSVVGQFEVMKTTGCATATQKANAILTIDELMLEIKQARMRANDKQVVEIAVGQKLVDLILAPFKE